MMGLRVRLAIVMALSALAGCEPPTPLGGGSPPPHPLRPDAGFGGGPDSGFFPNDPDAGFISPPAQTQFLDPRIMSGPATSLPTAPPAITGGTLFVTSTGLQAIVSDPDRDRIVVVDLAANLVTNSVTGTAVLAPGAQPFRAAEDALGHVHVVLRGTGEVFSFDPAAPASGQAHPVCAAPRGIAYDAANDTLRVACRSGLLVTLGTDGAIRSSVQIVPDLRDVVLANGRLFVSTFRAAQLIEVDPMTGSVLHTSAPEPSPAFEMSPGGAVGFSPSVAWRTFEAPGSFSAPSGTSTAHAIAAVHQRANDALIDTTMPGGYGSSGSMCRGTSIVESVVTFYFPDGTHSSGASIPNATLPVDMAISPDGSRAAIIGAANESGMMSVQEFVAGNLPMQTFGDCPPPLTQAPVENPIAVAYDAQGRLLVQQRDPSMLVVDGRAIALGGETVFDTGHAVFHANSGAFIACGSCHPEGGDDGRVWNFDAIGPRRTPALHGRLLGTEPFHWDGDMPNLDGLMQHVFTGRMSGPPLSPEQVGALGRWLDAQRAPVHEPVVDTAAVARGETLFRGAAGCASCHSGAAFTNNLTLAVGTGGSFQVPSLIGVWDRLPLMHDGCAPTLRARFTDATCGGGTSHGQASTLTATELDDLIAYLNTL